MTEHEKRIQTLEAALTDACRILQHGQITQEERERLTAEANRITQKLESLRAA